MLLPTSMKKDIHPQYFEKTTVRCACGNSFTIGSTKPEIQVEICSNCHPFYTGEEKLIDIAGRVERFRTRKARAESAVHKSATHKPAAKKEKVSKSKKK